MEDLGKLFARLGSSGIAGPDDIEGCTPAELDELEKQFEVRLPATYRSFLARMGHSAGRLFTHDHVETSLSEVAEWTKKLRAHSVLRLPNDAVVITARLGEQLGRLLLALVSD